MLTREKHESKYGRYQIEVWREDEGYLFFRVGTDHHERALEMVKHIKASYPAPDYRVELFDTMPAKEEWN